MNSIVLRPVTMIEAGAVSTTGAWKHCDYRFAADQQRLIAGTLTAGDSVIIEGTLDNINATVSTVIPLQTVTSVNFAYTVEGPFFALRVRKTGTAGVCHVKGII